MKGGRIDALLLPPNTLGTILYVIEESITGQALLTRPQQLRLIICISQVSKYIKIKEMIQ